MTSLKVLEILKQYSDEEHRLSQKDILRYLESDYGITLERKSVRRIILSLIECGCQIEYRETPRMARNRESGEMEEGSVMTDFYLLRDISDAQLRVLVDSVIFSRNIAERQRKELVKKLEGLSSRYFHARVGHIRTIQEKVPANPQLFYTVDILDDAIGRKKQVRFQYMSCGIDKKLHPKTDENGKMKVYTVNPYQIAAANGRYYLIGNTEPYDNVSHYRLDRIHDIQITEGSSAAAGNKRLDMRSIDLTKHMAEHIYMFSGESGHVTFRMKKYILNDVIDWFGTDIEFSEDDGAELTARVKVNLQAMRRWAVQYGPHVQVLREEIRADLQEALRNYQ